MNDFVFFNCLGLFYFYESQKIGDLKQTKNIFSIFLIKCQKMSRMATPIWRKNGQTILIIKFYPIDQAY